jgi:hypothetical protein
MTPPNPMPPNNPPVLVFELRTIFPLPLTGGLTDTIFPCVLSVNAHCLGLVCFLVVIIKDLKTRQRVIAPLSDKSNTMLNY